MTDDPSRPLAKRRKTQLACDTCRARKTGCDGKRPYCTFCTLRGWQATCSYQERSGHPSNPTLLDLEKRLAKLEDRRQPLASSRDTAGDSACIANGLGSHSDPASTGRDAHTGPPSLGSSPAIHVTAGVGAGSTTDEDRPTFGTGSNSEFAQQVISVASAFHKGAIVSEPDPFVRRPLGYAKVDDETVELDISDLILPPRVMADSLLRCFWELFHPLFPFLHQPSFDAAYNEVWEPMTASEMHNRSLKKAVLYSTINTVLAIGCQRNEELAEEDRESMARELYKRSVRLVPLDTLDTSSLSIVQLLLLRGHYLLYTQFANRCWNTVGVTVRAAQAIGLHDPQLTSAASSQIAREMRRRVWFSCMSLDRITSTTLGRPSAILKSAHVSLPASIDDEYLATTGEGQQPDGIPSRLDFFVYALKLIEIGESPKHLRLCHTQSETVSEYRGQDLGSLLDLNAELDRFVLELPPHLRPEKIRADSGTESRNSRSACFEFQSRVLKARVMYTRLRILRPLVVAEALRCAATQSTTSQAQTAASQVQYRLCEDMSRLCLTTVHEVLEELYEHLSHVYRTSPWHALYFAFAAASVLLAATLCPYLDVHLDVDPGRSSWEKAMGMFRFHKAHVPSAERGIETMELLRNCVDTRQRPVEGKSDAAEMMQNFPKPPILSNPGFRTSTKTTLGTLSTRHEQPLPFMPHDAATSFVETSTAQEDLHNLCEVLDSVPFDRTWFGSQDFGFDEWILDPS